jgi:hypothetical protein
MNHRYAIAAGIISIIAAFLVAFLLKDAYFLIISSLPLMMLAKKYAFILGFIESFVALFSVYLIHPFSYAIKLSGVVASVIGLPTILILVLYPLMGGLIGGFAGLLFASLREISSKNKSHIDIPQEH